MRSSELSEGIEITNENGDKLGESSSAAKTAISQVVVSRIIMASPGMGNCSLLKAGAMIKLICI